MDKHIVWSGEIYHKTGGRVSAGSLWAVLMRESVLGPKRLELYHTYTDYASSLPANFVLNLGDMLHVERNLDDSQPGINHQGLHSPSPSISSSSVHSYWDRRRFGSSTEPPRHQFTVTTQKEIHIFSTRSGSEASYWVGTLNQLLHGPPEQGVEYEFPVCVLPTPLSRSFGLCSNHVLKVSESDFHLYDASGTTPTSFICLLSNIENVALDGTRGVGSGTISLHCTNVCGTNGTVTFSTSSTADISRILNHRRMTAATTTPTTNSSSDIGSPDKHSIITPIKSQLHSLSLHRHMASLDSKLCLDNYSSSVTHSLSAHLLQHNPHPPVSLVKSLPPPTSAVGLMKQRRVEESSSSSDSEEDNDDENVHVSAKQLERIKSKRKISGDDFENVASWVRYKRDSLGRGTDGFNRVNSFPTIGPLNPKRPDSSQKPKLLPKPASRLAKSSVTSKPTIGPLNPKRPDSSQKPKLLPKPASRLAKSSVTSKPSSIVKKSNRRHRLSYDSSLVEVQACPAYIEIAPIDKRKAEDRGSHDLLVCNDIYEQLDSGSWQSQTPATNGNTDEGQPTSLHDYETVKELWLKGKQTSFDSNPDYDYVKDRILGVRGLPVGPRPLDQQLTDSSDEEEPYYY